MSRSRSQPSRSLKVVEVHSTLQDAKLPEEKILPELRACKYSEDTIFAIKLALEEAMTNAVKHGNRCDCNKHIKVRFSVTPRRTVIIVRDDGAGFCPENVPDPTAPERIAVPNGRGIMLMRAYMTKVEFRDEGREVYLMKRNERFPTKKPGTRGKVK